MAKKFKKVEIDDFDSLLDAVVENTPSKKEEPQKPLTEKNLKKKKMVEEITKLEEVDKSISKEENLENISDNDSQPISGELQSEDVELFPGFGDVENIVIEEQKLETVKEPEIIKEKAVDSIKEDIRENTKEEKIVKRVNHRETAVKEPSDFFKEHTKKELSDYGKQRLKEMVYSESMEETLFPLVCQDLFGFKGSFIGDKGGLKGEFLDSLAVLLYEIGKISKPSYITVNFSEIPDKFELDKLYVIEDLSDAVVNLFNMDESSESSSITQLNYKNRLESLIKSPGAAYVILNAIDTDLRGFLTLDARLPFLFGRKVVFQNLSNEAIVDRFIEALPELHQNLVTREFRNSAIGYLERNRRYFPFDNQELANYLANYTSRFEDLRFPQEKYNAKTLEESFSSIVGMAVVKKQIAELNEYLQIRQKLEKSGIKLPPFNLHMMFLGNPGVGKTTIARIIAKVLFDLGYIREEKLVEVTSKDLVSTHGNTTGAKTNKVIMNAMGGVLFVDEAYSLAISCGASGLEAIANLIKAMEDYKGDLVVMFAGYSLEMQEFVRSNSGIASRISYVFEFSDYTTDELFQIFEIKLRNTGMFFGESAKEPVRKLCKFAAGRRNFGNGRFVDKLLQRALTKHATLNLPEDQMLTLVKDSIPEVEEVMASFGRFGA